MNTPKHVFTYETGKTTYCGDAYCTGHVKNYLICSCGWKEQVYVSSYDVEGKLDVIKTKHVLESEGLM